MSCGSAGNCSAAGFYKDASGNIQAFVVTQNKGTWRMAEEVPGSAVLNAGGHAEVYSVSCASAGNCSGGGYYHDIALSTQAFVVTEKNGTWGKAEEVPGSAALNAGGNALVNSVSCASAGNCGAGGYYVDGSSHMQAFVVSEKNGAWGNAATIPGLGALNAGGSAEVGSVSCASAGNCSAGGTYQDGSGSFQAFVAGQKNGTWSKAREVPGLGTLNVGGGALINAVSCGSAGNCSAGGLYKIAPHRYQAFVAVERNGLWGKAERVPGTGRLNAGRLAGMTSVSCATARGCSGGGLFTGRSGHEQAFVAAEQSGTWRTASEVPGSATLNAGGSAEIRSVSCAAAGTCGAGGDYLDGSGHFQGFVVSQTGGTWGKARTIPGLAALNAGGNASPVAVSCATAAHCSAGGYYRDGSGHPQAFVVSET